METTVAKRKPRAGKEKKSKKDISFSYNQYKKFEGKQYTGMKIGRGHNWNYDKGIWKETKITPDLWEISYSVTKRRKGNAPEGSGVPVGTEFHWYIAAHQTAKKLNANDYSTTMTGLKYKLAHKRVGKETWSATTKTQRKHLVSFLKELIKQLEQKPIPLDFEYNGKTYKGEAVPIIETCHDNICDELEITMNDEEMGIIRRMKNGWRMDGNIDPKMVNIIGNEIFSWYE